MNQTHARRLLGIVAAVVFSAAVPALAVGATGPTSSAPSSSANAVHADTCRPGGHDCPIRIAFAPGAYSGQAHSRLTGIDSRRWFVVNAAAGQTMIVIVEGAGPTRGFVTDPHGATTGQPGGRVFDATVDVSGDQRIRVTESPMGEAWSGRVDVLVVVY